MFFSATLFFIGHVRFYGFEYYVFHLTAVLGQSIVGGWMIDLVVLIG